MSDAISEKVDALDHVAELPCPWPDPWADPVMSDTLAWLDRQVSGALALVGDSLIPAMGTPGWLALPDTSPAKLAAILRAARAWFIEGAELPHRLWTDLAQLRAARAHAAEEAFDDFGATVLRLRDGLAGRPTHAELQQARATYTRPALAPEQIQAKTRASWAAFELRHELATDGGDQGGREAA